MEAATACVHSTDHRIGPPLLEPGGLIALEMGYDQKADVQAIVGRPGIRTASNGTAEGL
jgi:methylase of polypeptide subunit release factors